MNEQLEFDLVSPSLAGPGPHQEAALRLDEENKLLLTHIACELDRQDQLQGPLAPKPSTEMGELQVLLGPIEWKKSKRRWERRLKKNVLAVRKVIIVLRNLLTAENQHEDK